MESTAIATCHSRPTLEITRLRASEIAFNANAPPQAQPFSIKRSLAIRVH
jgi:hypothetical protein